MDSAETNRVRIARAKDIPAIVRLIKENPDTILPRTIRELKELLKTTWVIEEGTRVVGCCCLEIYSKKICEIRTLAVTSACRGKGYGQLLVGAALAEANRRKIPQILTITSAVGFFEKLQFGPDLREKFALFWKGDARK